MAVSTSGVTVRARSAWVRDGIELLSSMRFSISLLTIICIASVIGTVVKQNEPANNYVNQFGPFWADVFRAVNLYTVYSAWWFLLILAFLVISTSLCIARNTPKILSDLKTFKEGIREQSLQAFHHKARGSLAQPPDAVLARVSAQLAESGWKAKVQARDGGTMIAARKGASNKLGYLAAHGAIVMICLGGLFDGDLVVRTQMALTGKSAFEGTGLIRDVPPEHRLPVSNPTFRGNLLVAEGTRAGTAILTMPDGVVLQDLPFDVELKKFIVEYYETGMPKLFASDIVIHDRETGEQIPARVEVNKPAFHRGIAIYQSSFDDGGSDLKLRGVPLASGSQPFEVDGQVGGSTELKSAGQTLTLEFTGLRVINVENFAGQPGDAVDVRKVDLADSLKDHLGTGVKVRTTKALRNVGPSVTYKLRDASGQGREFHNYMLPVELEGQRVWLAGVRDNPNENFRYLRIPVDESDTIDTWARARVALNDPALRAAAAERYVAMAVPAGNTVMADQLRTSATRALALFAGDVPHNAGDDPASAGGLPALSRFIDATVPEAEREKVSEVLLRILNGTLFELINMTRQQAGLKPLVPGETTNAYMTQLVVSLSDSFFYPAPVLLQLTDFTQLQASVFQVARAPGKTIVYIGAVLLIIGVFAMLYVRERRLWIWLEPEGAGTRLTTALSTTRRTLDADAEFERIRNAVLQETPA